MPSHTLKTIPQFCLPQKSVSLLAGCLADNTQPSIKNWLIQRFIKQYGVNMAEALYESPNDYASFNDFFIRKLKPEARPLANAPLISPVDGVVSQIGSMTQGQIIQAKNKQYTAQELLLCDEQTALKFADGQFATLYLSPKDYHRIHMPIEATLLSMHYLPGRLFSVQKSTALTVPKLFARNERVVVFFDTPLGLLAMVLVGAIVVGSIATNWHGVLQRTKKPISYDYTKENQAIHLKQGDEMGFFKLGSTVILLCANKSISWLDELQEGSSIQVGQALSL
jgi:phosphatidylserine decarboxylase